MPGARRTRKGQTGRRPSAQIRLGGGRDGGGPDRYDGRANTQAGSKGREPGGRWTRPYYDDPPKVIK